MSLAGFVEFQGRVESWQVEQVLLKKADRIPCRELTYPPEKAYLKMIFFFPGWDMLISWRVEIKWTWNPLMTSLLVSEKALFWGVGWPLKPLKIRGLLRVPGMESNDFGFLGNATWKRGLVLKHPLSCHRTSVFPSLWPEFTGKFSGKHPFQLDSPFFFSYFGSYLLKNTWQFRFMKWNL